MPEREPDVTLNTIHEDLIGGFADLKGEVRTGVADLKDEMRAGFADLKGEMRTGFTDLKEEMRAGFADLKGEMRTGFGDVKATLVTGFRTLPSRKSSEEMVRLLRESNRLQEERFAQVDSRMREHHLESQQALHAIVEGQRMLVEGQSALIESHTRLVDSQRDLVDGQNRLAADLRGLIVRIDVLIRRRHNGEPPAA